MTEQPQPDPTPTPSRRRRGRGTLPRGPLLAIVALVAVGAGVWWGLTRTPEPAASGRTSEIVGQELPTMVGDTSGLPTGEVAEFGPLEDLPELEESDPWLRGRAGELSPSPLWQAWLNEGDLLRRFVTAVANVSMGGSPAQQLDFLRPEGSFSVVVGEDGRTRTAPESWRRYDASVAALTSLDAGATARLFRGITPLLETVWRPLGFTDREFEDAAREAIAVVLGADPRHAEAELMEDEAVWMYADPALEALDPATKHLLRLGPGNLLRLQDWVASFAAEAGLAP